MEDEDKERLMQHLQGGGAALAVMADDDEVEATKFELLSLGGSVENYLVPDETMDELDKAADEADVEDTEEVELAQEGETVVLHYHRHEGDYEGWGVHVWTGYEGEVFWEEPLPPSGSDDFGIYFEIPAAAGAEGLGYIIHRGDEKDLWDDQYLEFAEHGREVWIMQNTPGYVEAPADAGYEEEE
jgi:hypothetical protein